MPDNNRPELELIVSADGSHTLYVPALDEHYHSVNGAINESLHVFIQAGLKHCKKKNVSILEIGLGTGLNVLMTALNQEDRVINYHALEKYPIKGALVKQLNFGSNEAESHLLQKIHALPWQNNEILKPNFHLLKDEVDLNDVKLEAGYDLVYFDAFAPEKQGDMWNETIFQKIYDAMNPRGILTTYCAKGVVRRTMQDCGFTVERIPGPKGKREMLRATKPNG
ncbi:tRNA (5-methylaminomethyl-2-thiouridine)(34)-methyltransferase MnmD [Carboxylicivirga sp. N1Y90]|uniref:tRNA (5-methylaminomethyl-2-thiouridine)(34)-methyltransferase MnmD n=1 Tax=Carboxylicivirga fragile TaxID=3417571 RepID=UPI003D358536|nr:tRNA (5-methylaminomethyl-2-thiouridine)(34)-methyltransferase MnmD [Marinilabiliaceae bacterium N1Y90]